MRRERIHSAQSVGASSVLGRHLRALDRDDAESALPLVPHPPQTARMISRRTAGINTSISARILATPEAKRLPVKPRVSSANRYMHQASPEALATITRRLEAIQQSYIFRKESAPPDLLDADALKAKQEREREEQARQKKEKIKEAKRALETASADGPGSALLIQATLAFQKSDGLKAKKNASDRMASGAMGRGTHREVKERLVHMKAVSEMEEELFLEAARHAYQERVEEAVERRVEMRMLKHHLPPPSPETRDHGALVPTFLTSERASTPKGAFAEWEIERRNSLLQMQLEAARAEERTRKPLPFFLTIDTTHDSKFRIEGTAREGNSIVPPGSRFTSRSRRDEVESEDDDHKVVQRKSPPPTVQLRATLHHATFAHGSPDAVRRRRLELERVRAQKTKESTFARQQLTTATGANANVVARQWAVWVHAIRAGFAFADAIAQTWPPFDDEKRRYSIFHRPHGADRLAELTMAARLINKHMFRFRMKQALRKKQMAVVVIACYLRLLVSKMKISWAVHRYLSKVRQIQRAYRTYRRQRKARISLWSVQWKGLEPRIIDLARLRRDTDIKATKYSNDVRQTVMTTPGPVLTHAAQAFLRKIAAQGKPKLRQLEDLEGDDQLVRDVEAFEKLPTLRLTSGLQIEQVLTDQLAIFETEHLEKWKNYQLEKQAFAERVQLLNDAIGPERAHERLRQAKELFLKDKRRSEWVHPVPPVLPVLLSRPLLLKLMLKVQSDAAKATARTGSEATAATRATDGAEDPPMGYDAMLSFVNLMCGRDQPVESPVANSKRVGLGSSGRLQLSRSDSFALNPSPSFRRKQSVAPGSDDATTPSFALSSDSTPRSVKRIG